MKEISIRHVVTAADLAALRDLLTDYAAHLAVRPAGAVGICLPGFEAELAALPDPYCLLLLAHVGEDPAGCVLIRAITRPDENACELKRLFIRPAFRGFGLARQLVLSGMQDAIAAGYTALYLDTVPEAMPEATRLYGSLGFEETERYNANSVSGVQFFRTSLHRWNASNKL